MYTNEFGLEVDRPAPVAGLAETENFAPRDDAVLVDPVERAADAFFPFGRAIARGQIGAAPRGIPVLDIAIALRPESDLGQVERHGA